MENTSPELKARLMRKFWSSEDLTSEEKADEKISRAWEELEPQRQGAPFHFQPAQTITDFNSCLTRIKGRVAELQELLPLFEEVPSLSTQRASALKEFQRMVSILDLAQRGMLPEDFSDWQQKLDSIDESLERTFNQVGSALRQRRAHN